MNVSDSEVAAAILQENDYILTNDIDRTDIVLINTCSIRENAEQRIYGRIQALNRKKQEKQGLIVGIIGCMAERLKEKLLDKEKSVDLLAGPDAYRDLPGLLAAAGNGQKPVNVKLLKEETYSDIDPLRFKSNGITAFVSIMRGCENMCTYCVVPFTRGAERSREPQSIINEIKTLVNTGYKEVTLLGQNVNSYLSENINFAGLLEKTAAIEPGLRIRFATSHPKDLTDEVLHVMAKYKNICKNIHLPVQSGSSLILSLMNRRYDRDYYLNRVEAIRKIIPECGISTDIMVGFCDETEEDHAETLSLMKKAGFDFSYMFRYSERPNTYAARKLVDNVQEKVKIRRLTEVIELQNMLSKESHNKDIGKTVEVLIEGVSKKSENDLYGRNSQNKVVVFPKGTYQPGDYAIIEITSCTSATLLGKPVKMNIPTI